MRFLLISFTLLIAPAASAAEPVEADASAEGPVESVPARLILQHCRQDLDVDKSDERAVLFSTPKGYTLLVIDEQTVSILLEEKVDDPKLECWTGGLSLTSGTTVRGWNWKGDSFEPRMRQLVETEKVVIPDWLDSMGTVCVECYESCLKAEPDNMKQVAEENGDELEWPKDCANYCPMVCLAG